MRTDRSEPFIKILFCEETLKTFFNAFLENLGFTVITKTMDFLFFRSSL